MDEPKRIFSEQEVGALVRRASELQDQAQNAGDYTPGVTQEELQKIAGDLGLDPKCLEQAIREAAQSKVTKGPLNLTEEFERVIDKEIGPDNFDALLEHLKTAGRRPLSQVGRTLQGQVWTGWGIANLTVTSRNGRTKINVKSNSVMAWLFSLHPATILTIVGLSALGPTGHILIGAAIAAAAWMAAIPAFGWLVRKNHQAAGKLTEQLAATVEEEGTSLRDRLADAPPVDDPQELREKA